MAVVFGTSLGLLDLCFGLWRCHYLLFVGNVGFDEMFKLVGVSIRKREFPTHVYI